MVPSASAALSPTVAIIHLLGVGFGRRDAARTPRTWPKVPMEDRTIGRSFTGHDGRSYRPSMVTAANGMVRRPTLCGDSAGGPDTVARQPCRRLFAKKTSIVNLLFT